MATIGFLGTGIMGVRMAARLGGRRARGARLEPHPRQGGAAGGARVSRWWRRRSTRPAGPTSSSACSAPARSATRCCSAGTAPWPRCRPGAALVVMSSIPVETARGQARAAAARGVGYLDAPVSGGEKGATEGTLAIMAGGDEALFARLRPVLEAMGRPTLVGPVGHRRTGQARQPADRRRHDRDRRRGRAARRAGRRRPGQGARGAARRLRLLDDPRPARAADDRRRLPRPAARPGTSSRTPRRPWRWPGSWASRCRSPSWSTGCSTTWWRTATATSTTARSSASCVAATVFTPS